MEDLKFRAWLKDYDTMVKVEVIDFNEREITVFSDLEDDFREFQIGFDDIVLVQYVGQKDKYKTDIYEGDIAEDSFNEKLGKIIKIDGNYCFAWDNIVENLSEVLQDITVVGNVFEDKEILENE